VEEPPISSVVVGADPSEGRSRWVAVKAPFRAGDLSTLRVDRTLLNQEGLCTQPGGGPY
jgi:hypothetical protein